MFMHKHKSPLGCVAFSNSFLYYGGGGRKAYVLSAYLESFAKGHFETKRVLELGAGTGLVGIVATLMGEFSALLLHLL